MVMKQFLNPIEEKVDDKSNKIVERIAKAYNTEDRTYKTDKEDVIIPQISHAEAFQALQTH